MHARTMRQGIDAGRDYRPKHIGLDLIAIPRSARPSDDDPVLRGAAPRERSRQREELYDNPNNEYDDHGEDERREIARPQEGRKPPLSCARSSIAHARSLPPPRRLGYQR